MYDDEIVSLSDFTKRNNMVKKSYMKTAAILFNVSPSIIETRIKNANTIDFRHMGVQVSRINTKVYGFGELSILVLILTLVSAGRPGRDAESV